jgi:hypothetical protein
MLRFYRQDFPANLCDMYLVTPDETAGERPRTTKEMAPKEYMNPEAATHSVCGPSVPPSLGCSPPGMKENRACQWCALTLSSMSLVPFTPSWPRVQATAITPASFSKSLPFCKTIQPQNTQPRKKDRAQASKRTCPVTATGTSLSLRSPNPKLPWPPYPQQNNSPRAAPGSSASMQHTHAA